MSNRFEGLDLESVTPEAGSEKQVEAHPRFAGLEDGIGVGMEGVEDVLDLSPDYKSSKAWKALEDAGADFDAGLVPLSLVSDSRTGKSRGVDKPTEPRPATIYTSPNLDRFRACTNLRTGHVFGIVGAESYQLVQHSTIARALNEIAPDLDYKVKLSNFGERIWFTADIGKSGVMAGLLEREEIKKAFEMSKRFYESGHSSIKADSIDDWVKEQLTNNLVVSHTLGGGGNLEFALYSKIKVCSNGLCQEVGSIRSRLRHTKNMKDRMATIFTAFGGVIAQGQHFAKTLSDWKAMKITKDNEKEFLAAVFPESSKGVSTRVENKRDRLNEIYHDAPGALPGTVAGLLQAATYYATHEMGVRTGGSNARRFSLTDNPEKQARHESLMWGSGQKLTNTAMQFCEQFAA